ncbi:MAG: GNAT family N-acetyltransferase [Firmicutes bacterium]|uniref:GNAT family N-acetyltransferase n=1 Tax=Sulfobacillus benefaciens TaxID=453960 RepID=A0A2T2WTQ0_9FIRM|nr:GNAT family N-acetyltransferase [Bacillota bacterium]MCL5014178.1 GNAT family N-acetyltransferase [Bacillota bacterium]PSR25616.1 MAG: GNAT family N-acetyltransferase [Sulfobacillus benefaciens]HBQ95181.1 GNAT family N-acetyltransferase [Sulfobacillus sp.]
MVELQYFERSDFGQLIEWIKSPEFLLQWGGPGFIYPLDERQLEQYISAANKPDATSLVYRVLDTQSGKVVGHISLGQIDRKNQSARIGKVLVGDPSMRGRGIGQCMMKAILKIAFESLKLHRVSLGVFDFNKSAIATYEKVGFTLEGVLRDCRKIDGEYWNICEMSILAHEWERLEIRT